MKKEVNLCIPTLRRLDLLTECIKSACAGKLKPTTIHVCDNGDICDALPKFPVPVNVFCPGGNYGVGRAWNRFLHICNDYIIISNDDVIFQVDTIEKLVNAAESRPKDLVLTCEGPKDWNWALFLQRKRSLLEIGEYDGFFYPAYYEDSDYRKRMKMKGYEPYIVPGCHYGHHGGATAKALQETGDHVDNEEILEKYYYRKWGGPRYQEAYEVPFNIRMNTGRTIPVDSEHALVDDEDYEQLSQYTWYLNKDKEPATIIKHLEITMVQLLLGLPHYKAAHINHNKLDNRRCNIKPCR